MEENTTGRYHKAIIAAITGGIVAAIGVLTGAMTAEDTFADVATVTWLYALSAFLVGSGVTGGSVAISKANTQKQDLLIAAEFVADKKPPYPDLEP